MAAQPALSQQEMTDAASTPHTMTRRSSRVRARFPILIASLSPATPFSLLCETLIVNAHGCATKVPQPLEIGTPVRLRIVPAPARRGDSLPRENSREVTGRIVLCQPIAGTQTSWVAGIELDTPGNFWGLSPAPEDWKRWEEPARGIKPDAPAGRPAVELKMPLWPLAAPAAKAAPPSQADNDELKKQLAAQQEMIVVLENRVAKSLASLPGLVRQQLAEAHQETLAQTRQQLSTMLAESVQEHLPAQTEAMVRLQERLVALESVPETIRQQIADAQQQTLAHVRQQLGKAVAESAQQQPSAQAEAVARLQERLAALESVPETIRQQIADAQQQTLTHVRQQLGKAVSQPSAQADAVVRLQERLAALESVPETIRQQIADAQQQTLTHVRQQLGKAVAESAQQQSSAQAEAVAGLQERLAALESVPETIRQQVAETQQQTLTHVRQQLGKVVAESAQQQSSAQADAVAKLQERLAALESVPETIRQQIADTQQQTQIAVREQLDAALAPLRPLQQEVAALRKSGQDAAQVRAAVAEQFEQLPWQIQQHAQAAFQGLQELARTELQRIITEFRSQDGQEAARRQAALEASAQALQKELTQAREALESTVQGVPQRVQEPITAAVQQALGQASAEISGQVARELEALQERGRTLLEDLRGSTEVLRAEREATGAQLEAAAAQRDELQRWLAEQRTAFTQLLDRHRQQLAEYQDASSNEVRQKLEQFATELAGRAAATLEEQIKSDIENQAQSAEADFEQRLGPMLGRASALREEILFLLDSLQKESARCQTQVNAMLEEKDSVDDWRRERTAEFQKLFEEALLETTGQIRGRLQLAQEMITEPMEKLRDQTVQQLQEQAAQQARQLREDTDELTERLRALRRDLESSLREALRAQAGETAAAFGQEIAQTAQECVQEWRSALASNLESISSSLQQKLPGAEK